MKRSLLVLAAAVMLAGSAMVARAAAQESLGNVARQQRQSKRPSTAKVYTNDDFAMAPEPKPAAPADAEKDKADKGDKAADAAAAKSDEKPKSEDKSKLAANFKGKADEQKKNIAQMEHDIDIAQREYRLKVAVYYADVGNNLRDSKKWAEEDRQQRAEIDSKQKALADAKQKLTDLQEEARKAGVTLQ